MLSGEREREAEADRVAPVKGCDCVLEWTGEGKIGENRKGIERSFCFF